MKGHTLCLRDEQGEHLSSHRRSDRPVLIGRDVELAFLESYWDSARDRQGRFILISGEAGVGKTRLVEELRRKVDESGEGRVLTALCSRQRKRSPYYPFRELHLSLDPPDQPTREVEKHHTLTADVLPVFARDDTPMIETLATKEQTHDPDEVRRKMFYDAYRFLRDCASHSTLLLILEDIHWADVSSLQFLHSVARNISETNILMVATCRSDETLPDGNASSQHLRDVLQRMGRELVVEKLELQQLSRTEADRLLRWLLPGSGFSQPFLNSMYLKTKGNPYLIRTGVELVLAHGAGVGYGGGWKKAGKIDEAIVPGTMPELVRRRINLLSDTAKAVLECAATLGHRCVPRVISEATEIPPAVLSDILRSLERDHRILRSHGKEYVFEHDLIEDVLYDDMSDERRRLLHERIGTAMEKLYAEQLDAKIDELAFHLSNANNNAKVLPYLERAGRRAKDLLAYGEALAYFKSAISLLKNTPTIQDRDRRTMHLMMCAGEVNQALGEWEGSAENLQQALTLSKKANDEEMEGRALMQMGLASAGRSRWTEAESFYKESMLVFERIGDQKHIGLTLTLIADIYFARCEWKKADGVYREALTMAMRTVDKHLMARILNNLGAIAGIRGALMEAIISYSKSLDLYRELEEYLGMAQVYHRLGIMHARGQEWKQAIEFYDKSIALSRRIGDRSQTSLTCLKKAVAALKLSDISEAERLCDVAQRHFIQVEDPLGLAECNKVLGMLGVHTKEWHYAQRRFEESIRILEACENLLCLAENLYEIGTVYADRTVKRKALDSFQRSMRLYAELGVANRVEELAERISAISVKCGTEAR